MPEREDETGAGEIPQGLSGAIAVMRARHGEKAEVPEIVRDQAEAFSEEFAKICRGRGVDARVISGARFGEVPEFPGRRLLLQGNFAVLVPDGDGMVFDWTARQYDGKCPVPLVTPLAAWRQTWLEPAGWPEA